MLQKRNSFWFSLGDYLSDPWGEFLDALKHNSWLRRIFFGLLLTLAFYFQSDWKTIGFFAVLWAIYEAVHFVIRLRK